MRREVSSGTHVDMRRFAVSRSNMDRFVSDVVPRGDIAFPHLKHMFLDWLDAAERLVSGEIIDDLHVRRSVNPKLKSKSSPSPSATNVSASVSSASFGSCNYRYNQEALDNVGVATSSEQVGKNKNRTL